MKITKCLKFSESALLCDSLHQTQLGETAERRIAHSRSQY